jgi:pimeloyl-ACP methyl ester carboxylesterase
MRTHWAYRRLAAHLAKAGAHVLRFDYFGTGDSAGDLSDGTLELWQNDICLAEKTLREMTGSRRIAVVGHRLGAVLAWRASSKLESRARDLLLWDPVVRGTTYLDGLYAAERVFASRLLYTPQPTQPSLELAGHALTRVVREATEAIDLRVEPLPVATRVHLCTSRKNAEVDELAARLNKELKRFTVSHAPDEGAQGGGHLLFNRVLRAIVGSLLEAG